MLLGVVRGWYRGTLSPPVLAVRAVIAIVFITALALSLWKQKHSLFLRYLFTSLFIYCDSHSSLRSVIHTTIQILFHLAIAGLHHILLYHLRRVL